MDNPLWNYSLALYSKAEVEEICLVAQDSHGVEVNFLLYAAWLSSRGECLSAVHMRRLGEATQQWREQVVSPLRSLRRQWRKLPEAAALRARLQALELAAERSLQEQLWADYQAAPPSGEAGLAANLQQVLVYHLPPGEDFEPLLERLQEVFQA